LDWVYKGAKVIIFKKKLNLLRYYYLRINNKIHSFYDVTATLLLNIKRDKPVEILKCKFYEHNCCVTLQEFKYSFFSLLFYLPFFFFLQANNSILLFILLVSFLLQ